MGATDKATNKLDEIGGKANPPSPPQFRSNR
jgi:hypothetical protein